MSLAGHEDYVGILERVQDLQANGVEEGVEELWQRRRRVQSLSGQADEAIEQGKVERLEKFQRRTIQQIVGVPKKNKLAFST